MKNKGKSKNKKEVKLQPKEEKPLQKIDFSLNLNKRTLLLASGKQIRSINSVVL